MKKTIQSLCFVALMSVATTGFSQNTFPANGNVGVGTLAPVYPLDVQGNGFAVSRFKNKATTGDRTTLVDIENGTGSLWRFGVGGTGNGLGITAGQFYLEKSGYGSVMTVNTSGYIGLGTITPSYPLHINNNNGINMQIDGSNSAWAGMYVRCTGGANAQPYYAYINGAGQYAWHYVTPAGHWRLNVAGDRLTVLPNGTVGIGTLSPNAAYLLSVNGSIGAKEVVVETGWADYVFEDDYKLKTIAEVENFIRENKHLPDVPSAAEVEKNGVKLGEMDAILLKKIEELTLYMIEVKKENEVLKNRINILEKE